MVERELLAAKREIIEKDTKVAHLEKQVAVLSRGSREGEKESDVRELKQRCLEYQKQISEMEVRGAGRAVGQYFASWVTSTDVSTCVVLYVYIAWPPHQPGPTSHYCTANKMLGLAATLCVAMYVCTHTTIYVC